MNEPDTAERWALLRTMLGTDGIVASEALIEMCGMVELMLDPHTHHKDRLRYGRPLAEELLRRYDARGREWPPLLRRPASGRPCGRDGAHPAPGRARTGRPGVEPRYAPN